MPKIPRRTALSLTELLVVLTIIGILSALLMPAVQRVQEAANITETRNELKQIALAYCNYAENSADQRGPKTQKELSPFYDNNSSINEALNANRITVIWGISTLDSQTMLAYETAADRLGQRLVAMGDASVQIMDGQDSKLALKTTGN